MMQYVTVRYSTLQYGTVPYGDGAVSTVRFGMKQQGRIIAEKQNGGRILLKLCRRWVLRLVYFTSVFVTITVGIIIAGDLRFRVFVPFIFAVREIPDAVLFLF